MPTIHAAPIARPHTCAARALLALALLLPAASEAACHIKVAELTVHMVGTRAMTSVGIDGQDVPLMIDTGAFYSMLSDAAAAQLHLSTRRVPDLVPQGLAGRIYARVATVDHLKLFKGTIPSVEFLVGGNALDSGAMGVIGRNLLTFADTEYDLAHGVVRLVFPNDDCDKENMAYWAEGDTVISQAELLHQYDTDFTRQPIRATVKLNGRDVDALFDTGATTTVSLKAATNAGVKEADMTPAGAMWGAGKGSVKAWIAPFDTFELGGEKILHNRLEVGDFDMQDGSEMLLGIDFFLSHHVYVSTHQKRMYFTYNGGPVFMLNKAMAASADASTAGEALDAEGYVRRGAALRARGDLQGALADFDRACGLAPQDAACFAARGELQQQLKVPAAALKDFDTALRLDPTQSHARLLRAWAQHQAGNADAALADLAELDKTLPSQAEPRLSMATLYAELHEPARALPQLDHWIAVHPHEIRLPEAYNERCWARVLLGSELAKALADCDKAVDLDDKQDASHLDSRGWVRLRLGQWAAAAADFDRALAIDAELPPSLFGRSIARSRLGDVRASQADLAAARKVLATIVEDMQRLGLSQGQLPVLAAKP
ncbi:MAG: aspartyl protease family protein [Burkholderiaceae bacterium]